MKSSGMKSCMKSCMKSGMKNRQEGMTLVMALLFLLILTMLSIFAASNSSLELKMAGNMQDSYSSFQSAEAGAIATMALSGTTIDPFVSLSANATDFIDGNHSYLEDPFINWVDSAEDHPLNGVSGTPAALEVSLRLTTKASICPRAIAGYSTDLLNCDYYDIASKHSEAHKASTEVHLGVVKAFIQKGNL